ncbi:MAG: FprA family A-type flavoprotein [Coriobacteriaceae bacterium]|jgi:flavorubredoxin|nr:FprA family A-type flavoprotein [Coriobacteriaceae bacterium]
MRVTDDITYIGVNDHEIDLFEGQYEVPNGMAYNSYVIADEMPAVIDSVEAKFGSEWLGNLAAALDGRAPEYLVVQHMEPDHSSNIVRFMDAYPTAKVVASAKAFEMMANFYGDAYEDRRIVVKEGDELNLGRHTLRFIAAPMVHWPEVIFTYDEPDGVLFSADAFGKFGALDVQEDWACEARRYYFGIVGKFGKQVSAVLGKVAALDVRAICPLHGPVLSEDLDYYVGLYKTWSSYDVESEGVAIAYCSVYGNTKEAVELLESELLAAGCPKVAVSDLARDDMAEAVEDAFRYGTLVLVSTTYNGDMFPFMKEFIDHLADHAYQNRKVAFMENGSWAPVAARAMRAKIEGCKGIEFIDPVVTIKSSLSDESRAAVKQLAAALVG